MKFASVRLCMLTGACAASFAAADIITLTGDRTDPFVGSVRVNGDINNDDSPFGFDTLMRDFNNANNNRAVYEFDLSPLDNFIVNSVTLTALFESSSNAIANASFEAYLYEANGIVESTDFDLTAENGVLVATALAVNAGDDPMINVDVTSEFVAILGSGATHVGVQGLTLDRTLYRFEDVTLTIDATLIPTPGAAIALAAFGGLTVRRRRA
ncbi:MAG: hypothetical protein AAGI30_01415 [Planctomycetota bacterium]